MRLAWLDGAERILRTPADAGDGQAAQQLGNLLAKRGVSDALTSGAWHQHAAGEYVRRLAGGD
jgi:hypothetical protein